MKEITKKILESGLVDQHLAMMMERWGQLEPGASDIIGRKDLREASRDELRRFAEEIGTLLDKEFEEIRETRLDIRSSNGTVLALRAGEKVVSSTVAWPEEPGYYFVPKTAGWIMPGTILEDLFHETRLMVREVIPLYREDKLFGHQIRCESEN